MNRFKSLLLLIDWGKIAFILFIMWLFVYMVSGENMFAFFYVYTKQNFHEYEFLLTITIILLVIILSTFSKIKTIKDWAKFNSLEIKGIYAKSLFNDGRIFNNYFKTQYHVDVISILSKEEGNVLFQFDFRGFRTPNKIWLSKSLKDNKGNLIKDEINF